MLDNKIVLPEPRDIDGKFKRAEDGAVEFEVKEGVNPMKDMMLYAEWVGYNKCLEEVKALNGDKDAKDKGKATKAKPKKK